MQTQKHIVRVLGRFCQSGDAGFNGHHVDAAQFARAESFEKGLTQMRTRIGFAENVTAALFDAIGQLRGGVPRLTRYRLWRWWLSRRQ